VSLQLALDAPEVVHTLALFELAMVVNVPSGQQLADALIPIVERYTAGDRRGAVDAFLALVDGPDWRNEIGRTVPGGVEQAETDVATLFECEIPSVVEWRFGSDEAANIQQPVFYLLGSGSPPVFAESRDLLRSWLPRMEDDVLPGANHLLHMRAPARAAVRLVDFLARHPLPT
jgi:pimeloyl-ACP methyl ester carboxylesterase